MYLLFTVPNCKRCDKAREILKETGYHYQEIDLTKSQSNINLSVVYNVYEPGVIVDEDTKEHIEIEDL